METQNESTGLDRRTFLTQVLLAGIGVGVFPTLQSCGSCTDPKQSFEGSGLPPYKIFEEVIHHLKTSPDHLLSRMEILIEQGDLETMFNFVRDEFFLIPANTHTIGGGNSLKWGIDYALRSGYATAREKAELLNTMYTKAGVTSKVVAERTNFSTEDVQAFFYKPIQRKFNPDITKKMLKAWREELDKPTFEPIDFTLADSDDKGEKLGEKLIEALNIDKDQYFRGFDFRWDNYNTPTVQFEVDGQVKYAHLFDTNIPFGESVTNNPSRLKDASEISQNDSKVSVKISYRDSIKPLEEKEIISGEWLAKDLVGHQMDVLFLNNLSVEQAAVTSIGNVRKFIPALSLQAIGKSEEYMAERSIIADPITLAGKRIHLSENVVTKVGDATLLAKSNPELQKQVVDLTVSAKSTGYPNVKLSISPKDSSGNLIEGLSAKDFSISENGEPVDALMESNQRTPRILIMGDTSMSMPSEYRGQQMEEFITRLKSKILEKYPAAIIDYWHTPSSLYTWLLKSSQTENDLVIYATDGHNNDTFDPKNEAIYRNGPPTIVLDVTNTSYDGYVKTFQKMAEVTNGLHLPVEDQQGAMDGIYSYLEQIQIHPYTFTYAAVGESDDRKVTVSVDNKRVVGESEYTPVRNEANQLGPRIIGLYLDVKYSNKRVVRRVLAGWDNVIQKSTEISDKMADHVHDFMLGSHQLSFEGAGPTLSAAVTDILKARLSSRGFGEALQKDELELAKEKLQEGMMSLSPTMLALMAPIDNAATKSSLTVPGGLRIALQSLNPGYHSGIAQSKFDFLPTSDYITLANDSQEGFKTTLKKTAQLAIREHKLFGTSTISELADETLINLETAREESWFSELDALEFPFWRERVDRGAQYRLFAKSAASRAFWDVDPVTGQLYGILPDGSGGGNCNFEHQVREFEKVTAALSSIIVLIGLTPGLNVVGGIALGIVAQYGKTLVALYAIASEAIIIMDVSGLDERMTAQLKQLAEAVMNEIVFGLMGVEGAAYSLIQNLITMLGESGAKCPY